MYTGARPGSRDLTCSRQACSLIRPENVVFSSCNRFDKAGKRAGFIKSYLRNLLAGIIGQTQDQALHVIANNTLSRAPGAALLMPALLM